MGYVLGLDMGVASLGWAVIAESEQKIDSGVRIFPAGLDAFGTSKESNANEGRRTARGSRRRIRRKAERKKLLRENLEAIGWIPSSKHEREDPEVHQWEGLDPYFLRAKALKEKVTLHELGRIILHLNQRRGFLSLRKSEDAGADNKTKGMLAEMTQLAEDINASGHKTLGNYLYQLREEDLMKHVHLGKKQARLRIRNRHLQRQLNHDEFDLIWTQQAKFHPDVLTDELRYGTTGKRDKPITVITPTSRNKDETLLKQFGLENLLFFQRKVYWPASSIGLCELEQPILFKHFKSENLLHSKFKKQREVSEKEIRRAPVSDRRFNEFRMLCEVNNMKVTVMTEPCPTERVLSKEERAIALDYAQTTAAPTLKVLKNKLAKYLKLESGAQLLLNLEAGGRTKFSGMQVDGLMRGNKGMGKEWDVLPEETKTRLVEILSAPENTDEDISVELAKYYSLTSEQKGKLLKVPFTNQRGNLCIKALEKLLPYLREGMIYMSSEKKGDSAMHAAGYLRRDEQSNDSYDILPRFDDPVLPYGQMINNPVVKRALTELRKVVNGVIRKYGKPRFIHIEMARDLKMSSKQREDYNKRSKGLEKERDSAKKELEGIGIIANRDAVERYLLWEQQGKRSAYNPSRSISLNKLFSGDIEVDHILPYGRSADNTFNNKCICFREENAEKSDRTPFEWLGHDSERYDEIVQFAYRELQGGGKYKKFTLKEIPEGFTERDLRDTAWMAKAAMQYLACLYPSKEAHRVMGTKGGHTATLRDIWQINSLLRTDGIELKSRDDHRHHALDAVIIALTTPARIKEIVKSKRFEQSFRDAKEAGKHFYRLKAKVSPLDLPWESFRQDLSNSLNAIWVSHRPRKKVSGPLHKETYYGKTSEGKLVVRKFVETLTNEDLSNVRDPQISRIIQQHLEDKKTLKDPIFMPSGTPIKKVRVLINRVHLTLRKNTPHKIHVQSEKTHHITIFSIGNNKCLVQATNMLEAARRLKSKDEKVYNSASPANYPEAEFMFHLSQNETIMVTDNKGTQKLFLYNTMNSNKGQMKFVSHLDARPSSGDNKTKLFTAYGGSFLKNFPNPEKVLILPTGEVRRKRD
ncbi:MAG: type II CRISPR RNA-guided endonuclease Cas9 [Bacteroidota bacterium]